MKDEIDCPRMILNEKPVTHIFTLSIYRKRLPVTYIIDKQRDKFLRELIWAIVVRAVCDDCRHSVGIMECTHKMI